jgi:hypothetical protein
MRQAGRLHHRRRPPSAIARRSGGDHGQAAMRKVAAARTTNERGSDAVGARAWSWELAAARRRRYAMMKQVAGLAAACALAMPLMADEITMNGFRVDGASIPVADIRHGGPPRDGIPAIDEPRFVSAAEARFLKPDDRVVGVVRGGVARAYPIAILNWHEVVNDRFGDEAVAVTFCPLCGTAMVFAAEAGGRQLQFGVSGLLYNSDVLLYNRQTESLWSQIMAEAVTGPMQGTRLEFLPTAHLATGQGVFKDWTAVVVRRPVLPSMLMTCSCASAGIIASPRPEKRARTAVDRARRRPVRTCPPTRRRSRASRSRAATRTWPCPFCLFAANPMRSEISRLGLSQ